MSGRDDAVGDMDPSAGKPSDQNGADQTVAPSQDGADQTDAPSQTEAPSQTDAPSQGEQPVPETDAARAELQDELRSIRGYGEDRV
ncbi:hypothetical protein Q9S36_33745 [Microbacterium sp. ARD31]|uniref:hypothetical protein n=1 Tax=Microbacterium sp. ARD31 TaxID=2962576 RepID=UPI002880D6C0|nr:hypothetical protein [Microbacterium sp. ARD31]MDT0185158.1 hypothetical protein [Microbacterium sp. ARD31]